MCITALFWFKGLNDLEVDVCHGINLGLESSHSHRDLITGCEAGTRLSHRNPLLHWEMSALKDQLLYHKNKIRDAGITAGTDTNTAEPDHINEAPKPRTI